MCHLKILYECLYRIHMGSIAVIGENKLEQKIMKPISGFDRGPIFFNFATQNL